MKRFGERNLVVVSIVTSIVLIALTLGAVNLSRLPFISSRSTYRAAFADAAGLTPGDIVSVAGVRVGTVTNLSLAGDHVLVSFAVQNGLRLGTKTSVASKVLTPLGQEYLSVVPAGPGQLAGGAVIPRSRTSETSTVVSTVDEAGHQIQSIDVNQAAQALDVTSQAFEAVPPSQTSALLSGLAQLSQVISSRKDELATLLTDVQTVSGTLNQQSGTLVNLLGQGDLVLQVLDQRHQAISQLLTSSASLTQQLEALLASHQSQIAPLLSDLQTISSVLSKDGGDLATAIPLLAAANRYLANATGSGTFADFVLPTALIPDNIIAQCSKPGAINPITGCNP